MLFSYWLMLYIFICMHLCWCITNFWGYDTEFLVAIPKCISRFREQNCDFYVSYNECVLNTWLLMHWIRLALIRTQIKCSHRFAEDIGSWIYVILCIKILLTRSCFLDFQKLLKAFSNWFFFCIWYLDYTRGQFY